MSDAADDPRIVLRSIAYGADARISPSDRVRAIAELREYELEHAPHELREELSPEQVRDELEGLRDMTVAALAVIDGPDAIEPPVEEQDLKETLALAVEVTDVQARRIMDLESALQRFTVHRLLPPAPEPVA